MMIVFKPLNIFPETTSDLDMMEEEILKNTSTNLSVISVKISSSAPGGSCFSIDNPLDEIIMGPRPIIVKNESGQIVNASRSGGDVYFENSGDFYSFYYSEELTEKELSDTGSCSGLG